MKVIHLDLYKETKIYFHLFDFLIKEEQVIKDDFLQKLGISASSYRRARQSEQNIGKEIKLILAKYFNLRIHTDCEIDKIEDLFNNIYFDAYYKKFDNFDKYLSQLDKEIEAKSLLYPLFYLMKCFIIYNYSEVEPSRKKIADLLMQEILKLKKFFSNDFNELISLIEIAKGNFIEQNIKSRSGLLYFTLASKMAQNNESIKALYYAQKARDIFLEQNNFLRTYYTNLILMLAYTGISDFQSCYDLAQKQLLSLDAFKNPDKKLYYTTTNHFIIASLGLKRYNETLDLIGESENYPRTAQYCRLVALYMTNKTKYKNELEKLLKDDNPDENKVLEALNLVLTKKNKEALALIKQAGLKLNFYNALKINFFNE